MRPPDKLRRGRHSKAIDDALTAARAAHLVEAIDGAAASAARHAFWAMDSFEAENKPYGPSKLLPAVTELLRELRMTPDARQSDMDDSLKDLINELSDTDPEISHTTESEPAHGRPEGR